MPSEQTNAGLASDRLTETSPVDCDARGDLESVPGSDPHLLARHVLTELGVDYTGGQSR